MLLKEPISSNFKPFEIRNSSETIPTMVKATAVILLATVTLVAFVSVGATSSFEEKRGLILKELSAEKVEGEYHGDTGNIQFSSIVRGDERSFTVASRDAEDTVTLSIKKPLKSLHDDCENGTSQISCSNEPAWQWTTEVH